MNFNEHYDLKGKHSILSPSQHYWLRYTSKEKFENYLKSKRAIEKGIEDHEFAATCIRRKQKLPKSSATLNNYVNDAIGYRMVPEQVLRYSDNCFGTADAIVFNERSKILRIHDLKTGANKSSMDQLILYAGIFCLEYKRTPGTIRIELRIYQSNDVIISKPTTQDMLEATDQIIFANKMINEIKEDEGIQ
jgi:hypothetical protein